MSGCVLILSFYLIDVRVRETGMLFFKLPEFFVCIEGWNLLLKTKRSKNKGPQFNYKID